MFAFNLCRGLRNERELGQKWPRNFLSDFFKDFSNYYAAGRNTRTLGGILAIECMSVQGRTRFSSVR